MVCQNATTGINIVLGDASACSLLCSYHPIYTIPYAINCKHQGTHMEYTFTTDDYKTIYKGKQYNASKMRLYQPSLHTYKGANLPAELVIHHNRKDDPRELNVCIPIESGGPRTTIVGELIHMSLTYANNKGSEASINIPDFDISSIIPKAPFYSYTRMYGFDDCATEADFIVFDDSASIKIRTNIMTSLLSSISDSSANIAVGVPYYYNGNGPTRTTSEEIYIDCHPTNSSDETTPYYMKDSVETVSSKKLFKNMFKDLFKNDVVTTVIVFIVAMLVLYGVFRAVK